MAEKYLYLRSDLIMRYISIDGTEYPSNSKRRLHDIKRRVDAAAHGKLGEFEEMMKAEREVTINTRKIVTRMPGLIGQLASLGCMDIKAKR